MAGRVSLPASDDLFRPTGEAAVRAVPDQPDHQPDHQPEPTPQPDAAEPHTPSGRIRHEEKMTVYVTSDELLEIEDARLSLRRSQGLAVDRGRLVRTAISLALADLEANGDDSALVRRLRE